MLADPIEHGLLPDLVGFNLRRAYFIATQIFTEKVENITAIQFAILELVSGNQFLSQKEIAFNIGTAPSVIVRPIRDLEAKGLVQRARSEQDRRNHHITLTDTGREFMQTCRGSIANVENKLLANLDADERTEMIRLLNKIIER
ncbi:MAG: MarR family winged helix-turn-helix transcriptional regulator [Candidatus Promineifilaceae bacterium]